MTNFPVLLQPLCNYPIALLFQTFLPDGYYDEVDFMNENIVLKSGIWDADYCFLLDKKRLKIRFLFRLL